MKTLKLGENTFKLAWSIIKDLKASEYIGVLKCIQCGMCTSVCPAARHTDLDPRVISKRVLDNDENLISDDLIWNCFYCYSCHSVCPVNNSVCEINQILRQKAIKKGNGIPEIAPFSNYAENFLEFGLGSIPINFFDELVKDIGEDWLQLKVDLEDIRAELGLAPLTLPEEDVQDINKILEKTGFKNRLGKIKRVKG